MTSYIYSKWKNSPDDCPVEFYSELDGSRFEMRKVEVFKDGTLGYASKTKSTKKTRLGEVPIPTMTELQTLSEFDSKEINKQTFEAKWAEAIKIR